MSLKVQKDIVSSKTEELFQKEKRKKENGTEQNIQDSQGSQKKSQLKIHQKSKILYKHAITYFQTLTQTFGQKEAYFEQINIENIDICFQPFLNHLYSDLNHLVDQKSKVIRLEQTIDSKTQKLLSKLQKQCRENIQMNLLRSKRFEKMNTFTSELLIRQIYPTKHYEIVRIQIHYLWYKTTLSVLNVTQRSNLHTCAKVSDSGTFGSIYFIKYSEQEIAVKCIPVSKQQFLSSAQYTKTQNLSKNFVQIIRQYIFLLMFSELKVGPLIKKIGGFDMIFYEDCIEFATEICQPFGMIQSYVELKKSLFVMHMFQVVHRDIKPGNILYSKTYQKPVFIDFGAPKQSKKDWGTMGFCSDEVVNLLSKKRGEADLYGNDMHGLSVSIKQLRKQVKISKKIQISRIKNYCFWLIQMKHCLYNEDYEKFHELWRKVRRQYPSEFDQIQSKLGYFFFELKPNEYLKYFFFYQVDENIQDSPQFSYLKNILKSEANDFYFHNLMNLEKQKVFKVYQIIYRVLQTENSQLEKKQISIGLILINSQIIKSRIFELQHNLKSLILLEKPSRTQLFQKIKQICIVTAYYSSLASEQYQASIQDKVSVCESTLKIIEMYQPLLNIEDLLIFQTPFTNLNYISKFYHFFMVKIWDKIHQIFKSKSLITTMMNLYLLGYPLTRLGSEILLTNIFLGAQKSTQYANLDKEERFLKIFYFMETRLIRIFFKYALFSQRQIKIQLNEATIVQQSQKLKSWLYLFGQDHCDDFLLLVNNQLEKYFSQYYMFSNQTDVENFIELLNSQKITQFSKCPNYKLVKKWKSLLLIILRVFSFDSSIQKMDKIDDMIQQNLSFLEQYKKTILPLTIKISQSAIANMSSKYQIFQKFYEVINYEPISQHYYVQKQLRIAIQRKDTDKMIKIASFLKNQLQFGLQLKNITLFRQILDVLYYTTVTNRQIQTKFLRNEYSQFLTFVFKVFVALRRVGLIIKSDNHSFQYLRPKNLNQLGPRSLQQALEGDENIRHCLFNIFQIANFFKSVQQMTISNETNSQYQHQPYDLSYFQQFISHYRQNHRALLPAQQWFEWIQQRPDVKKNLQFYISQRQVMGEILPTQTVIEELFGKLQAKNFLNQCDAIKQPSLSIAFEYFQAHAIKSKYSIQWCEESFQLYKITKKREPQRWNPTDLSNFLFQNIKFQRASENPYLALIYIYALERNHVTKSLIRRGLQFIRKSIPYLANHVRQMIRPKIYSIIYKFFQEPYILKMATEWSKYQGIRKEINCKTIIHNIKIIKSQMNSKGNRKFLNFVKEFKKNESYTMQSLDSLVEQRFFLQLYIEGYCFPTLVKKWYTKKLRRFYEVKQNYKKKQQLMKFKHNFKYIIRLNSNTH